MYNKSTVIPGIIIFVIIVAFPVWYNGLSAGPMPQLELPPGGEQECIAPKSEMRDRHMVILNEWRDDVLRDGNRSYVTVAGKKYVKALQLACMECHTSKEKFCDECHTYASVKPYCWDCHLTPVEAKSKKETH